MARSRHVQYAFASLNQTVLQGTFGPMSVMNPEAISATRTIKPIYGIHLLGVECAALTSASTLKLDRSNLR